MDISKLGAVAQFGQYNRVSSQGAGKRTDDKQTAAARSLFDKYLNAKSPENFTSHVKVGYEHGSPLCQLMDDHRAWKQNQPDTALPGAESSEEEKISYLREHYSGASDGITLFDALSAMKEMGMISQVEYTYALGGPLIRISKEEMESGSFTISYGERDEMAYWGGDFMTSPLVGFHGLNDIFNWLEEFRKEDHPFSISQAEARLLGYI